LFVKTDRGVQLIEPIVSEYTLEILDVIVVDTGRAIGQLRISTVALVVELERAEALASIWIVYEIANVGPPPLRPSGDKAFE